MEEGSYTVKNVARLAGITVRTLHHYDRIGLLVPDSRSQSGYRLYSVANLERLQEILFYRELGLGLDEIAALLSAPGSTRIGVLRQQQRLLEERILRLRAMANAVEKAIRWAERGITMDERDMFEVFGDFDPAQYQDEVEERWGETDAYKESARRTARYTKDDWMRIKEQGETVTSRLAALFDQGVEPGDPRLDEVVEQQRSFIDSNFYPCSVEMMEGLGEMYVADPRFAETYDKIRPGLAVYFRDAIRAWAQGRRKG